MREPRPFTKSDWEDYPECKSTIPYITCLYIDGIYIDIVFDDSDTRLYFYKYGTIKDFALNCFTIKEGALLIVDCLRHVKTWQQLRETLLTKLTVTKTASMPLVNQAIMYSLCGMIKEESRK